MTKPIILAGGSGFLGRRLARTLTANSVPVVVLSRRPATTDPSGVTTVVWNGRDQGPWTACLDGAAAVVNLVGKNVDCRYTPAARAEIDASRVDSVRALDAALLACPRPPPVLVQAASTAFYGDAGERPCAEDAPAGSGIPPDTCLRWEAAIAAMRAPVRTVVLRISFALATGGGALGRLERLTRWGLGGAIGNGRQYISWIHIEDLERIVLRAIADPTMAGVYNATAPDPRPNAAFMRALRRALGRPWSPPTPTPAVRLGCWLMRTEPVLALTGRRAIPQRLLAEGFAFTHPDLDGALNALYRRATSPGSAPAASGTSR